MRDEKEVLKNIESLKKELEEIQNLKKVKLEEKKTERYNDVNCAYENYMKLKNEYIKDYGYFIIKDIDCNNIDNIFNRVFM